MDQQQIDRIVKAISDAGAGSAEHLAKMANEETGFGIWQDKVIKNLFASKVVYDAVKNEKDNRDYSRRQRKKSMGHWCSGWRDSRNYTINQSHFHRNI